MERDSRLSVRFASLLFIVPAIGFGLSTPFVLTHLHRQGELPTILGIRALSGPFEERLSRAAFTSAGWALVATSAAETLAGVWLWQGRRRGAQLGLAISAAALVLAAGFALPALLVAIPIRVVLLLARRDRLR